MPDPRALKELLKHNSHIGQSAALENVSTGNLGRELRMQIRSVTSTIFAEETSSSSSLTSSRRSASTLAATPFDWPCATAMTEYNIQAHAFLHVHGIVPGVQRAVHSGAHSPLTPPPPKGKSVASPTPTSLPLLTSKPRESTYPKPSPPGFLYPTAIIPAAAFSAQRQSRIRHQRPHSSEVYHSHFLEKMDYQIRYLTPGLKALFLGITVVVVVALAWTLLVWLVNFPPSTWTCSVRGKKRGKKMGDQDEEKEVINEFSRYDYVYSLLILHWRAYSYAAQGQ